MKLFLDTAFVEQIEEAKSWGILDGVTTNPTHVSHTGRPARELYEEICGIVDGIGYVDPNFDNGGRHENLVIAVVKAGHDRFFFFWFQTTVKQT